MSSDRASLLEMGFTEAQVTKALSATSNSGLTQALDYIDKHADKPTEFWAETDQEQDSLKCLDCGKLFKNTALANYHGEKSGHENFEETTQEIAPLTDEEKAAKLEELKAKMLEKKKLQAKQDAEDAKKNEAIRRKGGKEQQEAQVRLAVKEAEKEAAQRKADKLADAKARAAVRAQIEADKKARAEKAAREKALRDGTPLPAAEASSSSAVAAAATTNTAASKPSTGSAQSTRLQIRLPNGAQPLTHTVPSTVTLGEVRLWVVQQAGIDSHAAFASAFPRKTYGSADDSRTMAELGLAPSAVLIVQ
ncbi:hypothetical protein OIO90_004683 [Microbotryomycetes sp. JL221]|nr:hypothetical protein OIO90_004683 [Microbotryomycetes sp. JL221]